MWLYNDKELTDDMIEGHIAFVYLIENLTNGKKYIGKKIFKSTRRKKVKGKTKIKKVQKESNWREYFGSNKALLEDVAKLGPNQFRRIVLKLCETKGTANYWEMKYQILNEVLEKDDWYNDQIYVRVHRSHIKTSR